MSHIKCVKPFYFVFFFSITKTKILLNRLCVWRVSMWKHSRVFFLFFSFCVTCARSSFLYVFIIIIILFNRTQRRTQRTISMKNKRKFTHASINSSNSFFSICLRLVDGLLYIHTIYYSMEQNGWREREKKKPSSNLCSLARLMRSFTEQSVHRRVHYA